MTVPTTRTIENTRGSIIAQRIGETYKTAADDCLDKYGSFIWALARKFTASGEEAERASRAIFNDIWRYGERAGEIQSIEENIIVKIALRRLIKPPLR